MLRTIDCWTVASLTLYVICINVLLHWWKLKGTKLSPEEQELVKQMDGLLKKEKKLNSVDTFVEHSKLQRVMNQVKKQQDLLAIERMKQSAPSSVTKSIATLIKPLSAFCITCYFWGTSLVELDHSIQLFPFARVFALPSCPFGSISATAWVLICERVMKRVLSK